MKKHFIHLEKGGEVIRKFVVALFGVGLLTLLPGLSAHASGGPDYIEKTPAVHHNWGYGGPEKNLTNNFYAMFDQSQTLHGDYFIQTMANDGIRVNVNRVNVIKKLNLDTSQSSLANISRTLLLNQNGPQRIITNYHEASGKAGVYSDVVPFGQWLTYYYADGNMSGIPTFAKVLASDKLKDSTTYAARYVTAKRLPAGDYVFRSKGNRDYDLLVDGKTYHFKKGVEQAIRITIHDRTDVPQNQKDVHWIEVRQPKPPSKYIAGDLSLSIQPFSDVMNMSPSDGWLGVIYDNENFTGKTAIIGGKGASKKIPYLGGKYSSWGSGSPSPLIGNDTFSAWFTKVYNIEKPGYYIFSMNADDGVQVYVDNQKTPIMSQWSFSRKSQQGAVWFDAGLHKVRVKYREIRGAAGLVFHLVRPSITETSPDIHHNWGTGGPTSTIGNQFTALFNQTQNLHGDYFIQTLAHTGVKMTVNGKSVINKWDFDPSRTSLANINRTVLLNQSGVANISTAYHNTHGEAGVYSDVVPLGNWLAYYYSENNYLSVPASAKVIHSGTISDNSQDAVRYTMAKRLAPGQYVIRGKASRSFHVFIDGKMYSFKAGQEQAIPITIHQATSGPGHENNIHWIELHILKTSGAGDVHFTIQPYSDVMNVGPNDGWVGEVYNNEDFTGTKTIVGGKGAFDPIPHLDKSHTDWGSGSPSPVIDGDTFSAKFRKVYYIPQSGYYDFGLFGDDSARVYLDGQSTPTIDEWQHKNRTQKKMVWLDAGVHKVSITYREYKDNAALLFYLRKTKGPIYLQTQYQLSFNHMLDMEMAASPKTDGYNHYAYVYSQFIDPNTSTVDITNGVLNVRKQPSGELVGQLTKGTKVAILGKDGDWYKIHFVWQYAEASDVAHYLNPDNFSKNANDYFQFLKLSNSTGLNSDEVNAKILTLNKGILAGKANDFIQAAEEFHINEVYLISHALLETGDGGSHLATGVKVKVRRDANGQIVYASNGEVEVDVLDNSATNYDAIVYNMYGIGAVDRDPLHGGARRAYNMGWTTPDKAIIGGAKYVSENWIHAGQDTLYKMRWNPAGAERKGYATHQYATDIAWADKQVNEFAKLYSLLTNYTLVFDVPKYQ